MGIANASERVALLGGINPQLLDDASATSDWVPMKNFDRVLVIVRVGATDTTVDAKLQGATSAAGAGAADLSGKAITQLSGTDDNKAVLLEVKAEELSATQTHVAVVVTAGDGATGAYVHAEILGFDPRYMDAANFDSADVAQIVAPSA